MSKSTVLSHIQQLPIHKKKHTICPMCALTNVDVVEIHKSHAQHQRLGYIKDRNIDHYTQMFVLDFSKVKERQVLIVSIVTPLSISWKHYIAPNPDTPNDSQFVINDLSINKDTTKVIFWSDGGRKHFKNRITLQYLQQYKQQKGIEVVWNFFLSYHGFNPCDLGASHIKNKIKIIELETGVDQSHLNNIISAGNIMDNHQACIAQLYNVEFTTLKKMINISKYHQFIIGDNYIEAFIQHPIRPVPQHLTVFTKKGPKQLSYYQIFT